MTQPLLLEKLLSGEVRNDCSTILLQTCIIWSKHPCLEQQKYLNYSGKEIPLLVFNSGNIYTFTLSEKLFALKILRFSVRSFSLMDFLQFQIFVE